MTLLARTEPDWTPCSSETPHPERWWVDVATPETAQAEPPVDSFGFLRSSELCDYVTPKLARTTDLAAFDAVVMLGEAGTGKSTELERLFRRVEAQGENKAVRIDLGQASSDTSVSEFFHDPVISSWLMGSGSLELFLDSWDECVVEVKNLAKRIAREIAKLPADRLRIRIASRTASWLTSTAQIVFGSRTIKTVAICPMSRADVREVAAAMGASFEPFLDSLTSLDAAPLATVPVTLRMLLEEFRASRSLPSTKWDLYSRACRRLCDEENETLKNAQQSSTDERLSLAKRIAVVSLLCGRPLVALADDERALLAVSEADLAAFDAGTPIQAHLFKETLRFGLFRSAGSNRMTWAHRSYGEFLAAAFLIESKLGREQLDRLLTHSADRAALVPQLEDVASWLAAGDGAYAGGIADRWPDVVLAGDTTTLTDDIRKRVVKAIIPSVAHFRTLVGQSPALARLNYPSLIDELRTIANDSSKESFERAFAISIAKSCKLSELAVDLLSIARNPMEDLNVREHAVDFVAELGDNGQVCSLLPLATGDVGGDDTDHLRALAVKRLWPLHIDALMLFGRCIRARRSLNVAYGVFLESEVVPHLSDADLPIAIRWLRCNGTDQTQDFAIRRLGDAIQEKVLGRLVDPGVRGALIEELFAEPRRSYRLIPPDSAKRAALNNPAVRRLVLRDSFRFLAESDESSTLWGDGIVRPDDGDWLLDEFLSLSGPDRAGAIRLIGSGLFMSWTPRTMVRILELAETTPDLAAVAGPLFAPMPLESTTRVQYLKSQALRAKAEAIRKNQETEWAPPDLDFSLDEMEFNVGRGWAGVMHFLLAPENPGPFDWLHRPPSEMTKWESLSADQSRRILDGAVALLRHDELLCPHPLPPCWWSRLTVAHMAWFALQLLYEKAPRRLDALDESDWKWLAPVLLGCPSGGPRDEQAEAAKALAKRLATQHRQLLEEAFSLVAGFENVLGQFPSAHEWLAELSPPAAEAVMLPVIRDSGNPIRPKHWRRLAQFLFEKGSTAIRDDAVAVLSSMRTDSWSVLSVKAAATWLEADPETVWQAIGGEFRSHPEWGRAVLAEVAHEPYLEIAAFAARFPDEVKADLHIWLIEQFPFSGDPSFSGTHARVLDDDDGARSLRDTLLSQLIGSGTKTAVAQVERIFVSVPDHPHARLGLAEARRKLLLELWNPPTPKELAELVRNDRTRLVQSGADLLSLLEESIHRFELALHGETPTVGRLWNTPMKNGVPSAMSPKPESALSDELKLHLEADLKGNGLIVNREVEIRGRPAVSKAEETDIHVDVVWARPNGARESVKAIIEVKSSWNKGVETDMKEQLVDRYLAPSDCRHGLFVVGWYDAPLWDPADWRAKESRRRDLAGTNQYLQAQARALSSEGVTVRAVVIDARLS